MIRQLNISLDEYRTARNALISLLSSTRGSNFFVRYYLEAIRHFETCVLSCHHAICAYERLEKLMSVPLIINRHFPTVRLAANRIKHFDEDIAKVAAPPPSPIWLTNTGLRTLVGDLSFFALSDIYDDLIDASEFMASAPPSEKD